MLPQFNYIFFWKFCSPYKPLNTALHNSIEREMTVNNSVQAFHIPNQD